MGWVVPFAAILMPTRRRGDCYRHCMYPNRRRSQSDPHLPISVNLSPHASATYMWVPRVAAPVHVVVSPCTLLGPPVPLPWRPLDSGPMMAARQPAGSWLSLLLCGPADCVHPTPHHYYHHLHCRPLARLCPPVPLVWCGQKPVVCRARCGYVFEPPTGLPLSAQLTLSLASVSCPPWPGQLGVRLSLGAKPTVPHAPQLPHPSQACPVSPGVSTRRPPPGHHRPFRALRVWIWKLCTAPLFSPFLSSPPPRSLSLPLSCQTRLGSP